MDIQVDWAKKINKWTESERMSSDMLDSLQDLN